MDTYLYSVSYYPMQHHSYPNICCRQATEESQLLTSCGALFDVSAVKCNNHPILLQVLKALGAGFDCASKVGLQSHWSLVILLWSLHHLLFVYWCVAYLEIRDAMSCIDVFSRSPYMSHGFVYAGLNVRCQLL